MKPRDAFVKTWLEGLNAILPGHKMLELYQQLFDSKSDAEFEVMVQRIEVGDLILPLIAPNLKKVRLNTERNLAIALQWGHEFYQHLVLTDPVDPSVTITTPEKYLVTDNMIRRQAQTLEAKQAIPKDISHIDDLTGQVTGASKGSSMTKPELHVMDFHQLENCIIEQVKARGGDQAAWEKMERSLLTTGQVRLEDVDDGQSRAKSVELLEVWLKGAHIGNNATGRN